MASKSLGTLTLDLIARVGGFVGGMDRAERASDEWRKKVAANVAAVTAGLAAASAAAVAVGAAGFALLKNTSEQIAETDRWAKSLKMSTQELLAWQFAAEKAGIAGDSINDIFKDLGDRIGDAVLNKSGDAVEVLNTLGLSAEKLSKTTPDKQMLAIGEALGKIGTNAGKINILESLGSDLSRMLPLFENSNEKLKQFLQLSKDYGIAPDPQSIDDLVKVNLLFEDMAVQVKGLKMEIAAGLAHVDLSPLNNSLSQIKDVLTDPEVLQGIANLVSEVAKLAGWLIKAAAGAGQLVTSSGNRMAALGNRVDMNNADQVQQRIDYLSNSIKGRSDGMYGSGESFFGWLTGKDDSIKAVSDEIDQLTVQLGKLKKQSNSINIPAGIGPDTASSLLDFQLGKGETNGEQPKDKADSGAAKLESAFKSLERSYLRQISLIDTTGKKTAEVTEQQKLQFDLTDEKLKGINATQIKRLEYLAQEVDRLNALKKANEENAKVAAFVASLNAQNANAQSSLNIDVSGAGLGDKGRDRLKENLNIEREFLDQQRELQARYQSDEISKSLYDQQTSALNSAMSDRLKIQDDYYKSMDAMQSDWMGGVSDGLANWLDTSSNYSSSAANIVSSAMDGALDNVALMLTNNKASWKDWASSILSMIAKVALQMAAVNIVSGIVGSIGGSLGGAAAGSMGSGAAAAGSTGAMGMPTNYQAYVANAKGGVYQSHDLSKYSGSVVSSPTFFAFAKGAGLMGEAGPEAIMPLTRAADGSLGVRAVSTGSGGGGTTISVDAPVSIMQGDGQSQPASSGTMNAAKQLQGIIQQTVTDRLRKEIAPGGLLYNKG